MIDEMTVFDAEELFSYWARHPPVHLSVAAALGIKSEELSLVKTEERSRVVQPEGRSPQPLGLMLAGMPGLTAAKDLKVPPPIFDVAELMAQRPS